MQQHEVEHRTEVAAQPVMEGPHRPVTPEMPDITPISDATSRDPLPHISDDELLLSMAARLQSSSGSLRRTSPATATPPSDLHGPALYPPQELIQNYFVGPLFST
ncbi:hypothetical protein CPB84DRAFT_1785297, partial [Gymnopilus junonius]